MRKEPIRILAVLGLMLLGGAVLVSFVQGTGFRTGTKIAALAGLGFLAISAVLGIGTIVTLLRTRQGRFGLNVLTGILVAFGIALLVNILAARFFARADVTAGGRFSLAPQTRSVLEKLGGDLTVYVSVPRDNPSAAVVVNDLVTEYDEASSRVRVQPIDPAREPGLVEKLGISGQTWVVLDAGGRLERLGPADMSEERLTNAILRVTKPEKRKIYATTGHGERSFDDGSPQGYGQLAAALADENYVIAPLQLLDAGEVPADAAVVFVASPQTPLYPREAEILGAYLDRGGHVLLALDLIVSGGELVDLGFDGVLATYGLTLGKGLIYDDTPFARQRGVGRYAPLAGSPPGHPVTAGFTTSSISLFKTSRGVWHEGGRGRASVLAATVAQTWEELDFRDPEAKPRFDPGEEQGPIPIVYAVEAPATVVPALDLLADRERTLTPPLTRLVVVGDADFAANEAFGIPQLANRDLVLNAIAWLAEEEDLIAVRPKDPDERRLLVSAAKRNVIRMLSTALFPMAVVIAGVLVWFRRRAKDV